MSQSACMSVATCFISIIFIKSLKILKTNAKLFAKKIKIRYTIKNKKTGEKSWKNKKPFQKVKK